MLSTILTLATFVKKAVAGKKTIATSVGLLGLSGAVATDTVKIDDPYAQAAGIILVALSFIFARLGAKKEGRDLWDAIAEGIRPR